MKSLVSWIVLSCLLIITVQGQSDCRKVNSHEVTRWGGNQWITSKEDAVYKSIAGTVAAWVDDSTMENVLVEVFDRPDYLLCEWLPNNPNGCTSTPPETQRRLAAFVTGKSGKFRFVGLSSGKYELRVSKDTAWNVNHIYVGIDPKNGSRKTLRIGMTVGD